MIAIPGILAVCAEKAGIKMPEDIDKYDPNLYPHWHVYLNSQLGSPMPSADSHWRNAEVVKNIPEDQIRNVTATDLITAGFSVGFNF